MSDFIKNDFIKNDSKDLTWIKAQVAATALRRARKDLILLDRDADAEDLGVDKALLNAAMERRPRCRKRSARRLIR